MSEAEQINLCSEKEHSDRNDKVEVKDEVKDEDKQPAEKTDEAEQGSSGTSSQLKRKAETETEDGDDGGETVTMLDVLQDEAELEEDAKAVLGGADDKNCTYMGAGYAKRQPLYSCLTCTPRGGGRRAGVCLACSYQCHEGHELVELYTKRRFRCDCGNGAFDKEDGGRGAKCRLEPGKANCNESNK